ncbi:hypothetical protein COLO4_06461 [Corchorus olitorius]|uniref:Uncharacterized protein n=1 Tax=Corchorus olitorius TaxID=93759 RepID=A0A1R3KN12_9ROSI|nr:hypothetical protein COLO4_06461 [Corchorus olitorius]
MTLRPRYVVLPVSLLSRLFEIFSNPYRSIKNKPNPNFRPSNDLFTLYSQTPS